MLEKVPQEELLEWRWERGKCAEHSGVQGGPRGREEGPSRLKLMFARQNLITSSLLLAQGSGAQASLHPRITYSPGCTAAD